MLIGVPKEIKVHEYRVGLTPGSVRELTRRGHRVMIETNAGREIGFDNKDYTEAGAKIVGSAAQIFAKAKMIVKVKEPQASECKMLNEGQVLFTYLHLAPDPKQTNGLLKSGAIAIAYETVTDGHGRLPLLAPMSEVAGRMAAHVGAHCLEKASGGRGVLLGGVPGVAPAKVVVIGGGVVGTNAAVMAVGLGAEVVVFDNSAKRLAELDFHFAGRLKTIFSTASSLEEYVTQADLVIGAVLIPGAAAPKLVTRKMIKDMPRGSVIVDVAIDQGGCFATSKATTHANPTYVVDDVVHYCVANMPGAVARTSTLALNNATLPYTMVLAEKGYRKALRADLHLRGGLNIHEGKVTYEAVARALSHKYHPPEDVLAA
ncbi:MAG: alanine dehydrogenase [Proteobacteria bacterium]|nr:alanine dehydrogenase [Pseudomonadota bacterium]